MRRRAPRLAASALDMIRAETRAVDPSLPILTLTTMRALRDETPALWAVQFRGRLFVATV